MPFSCYESDASSCPTTPSSRSSTPTPGSERETKDAHYVLLAENELLRSELESIAEKLEELETRFSMSQQRQSPKDWIRENLEEAQQLIDNIVGIKGITEDPLNAAFKMGISQPQPHHQESYHDRHIQQLQQQMKIHIQMPRVSISSSIVPSNEELYGY
jgi:dynactin complex subunit